MYQHDPYRFQVCAPEDTVVVVVNGHFIGSLSQSASSIRFNSNIMTAIGHSPILDGAVSSLHIVCYTPMRLQEPNVHIQVHMGPNNTIDLGCLTHTEVITATCPMLVDIAPDQIMFTLAVTDDEDDEAEKEEVVTTAGASSTIRSAKGTRAEEKKILANVVQLFHDDAVNPSFGALRLRDIEAYVSSTSTTSTTFQSTRKSSAIDLKALLTANADLCHLYIGKDNDTWVVLHSHSKKIQVTPEHARRYAALLRTLVEELACEEKCLADLFRKVSKQPFFHPLLASNFTILKKFLIKHNTHFAWFQDERSRTTKVMLQPNAM